jgi:hypothetical protein
MNISRGFRVVREGLNDGSRNCRVGVFAETDGGFVRVNGLTRPVEYLARHVLMLRASELVACPKMRRSSAKSK